MCMLIMMPLLKQASIACLQCLQHLFLFSFAMTKKKKKKRLKMFRPKGRHCLLVMRFVHICFADRNTEGLKRSWAMSQAALPSQRQRQG